MRYKYSVVIPLYNKEATINRTLDSVFVQNHEVDVIVVDDGSTDNGAQIVRCRADDRIKLVTQPNRGVAAARNRGIDESRNELIALIDADDEWLPNYLDTIDRLVSSYPLAGAYTTSFQINDNKGEIKEVKHPKVRHPFFGQPDFFHCARYGYYFCASSIVLRKSAIKHIGGFRTSIWLGEDSDAWGRLALHYQVAHSSVIGATYHLNVVNQATKKRLPEQHCVVESYYDYIRDHPDGARPDILIYINKSILVIALHNVYCGWPMQARSLIARRPSNKLWGSMALCCVLTYVPVNIMSFARLVWMKISG